MGNPGLSSTGKREWVGVRNRSGFDNPLPGAQVPPQIRVEGRACCHGQQTEQQDAGKHSRRIDLRNLHYNRADDYKISVRFIEGMDGLSFQKRRPAILNAFLLAMVCCNLALAVRLVPFLQNGYQDFTIYYTAGKLLAQGHGTALYRLDTQYEVQREFSDVPS